jgi:aminopeptidase N
MLRNYVGDDAFYKSLNLYLTTNKFKSGEAAQLRLAFEEITGEDLNWFWNQWYYGSGHPKVDISYGYDAGKVYVYLKQVQEDNKVFRLPLAVDVYNGNDKKRYKVWMENKTDTLVFNAATQPYS